MAAETAHCRRLRSDLAKVRALLDRCGDALTLEATTGDPPTRYVLRYRCESVTRIADDQAVMGKEHRAEIKIPSGYPLEPPTVRILTPIENPHVFTTGMVCLGSRWQVGEGLDNLVLRVGAILRFEPAYLDFKSPANLAAAHWASAHLADFPLGPDPLGSPAPAAEPRTVSWKEPG